MSYKKQIVEKINKLNEVEEHLSTALSILEKEVDCNLGGEKTYLKSQKKAIQCAIRNCELYVNLLKTHGCVCSNGKFIHVNTPNVIYADVL